MRTYTTAVFAALLLVTLSALAQHGPDPKKVQIKANRLSDSVYELEGAGGNIGVLVGKDGVVLVDSQFAVLTPKIKQAVAKLSGKPIRYVINTHWHGDHVGGNENLAKGGSVIVAHDNVRKRMSVEQFNAMFNAKIPASPAGALPVVTFTDEVSLHINGETVHIFRGGPAHTDGDAVVHFVNATVVHMGDTMMTMSYP
jgi:glyoxylase-like metal-dependent hydrolase (beta-lactamase superfamily II)